MIKIIHLFWIVPLSTLFGILLLAFISAGRREPPNTICQFCTKYQNCKWWCGGSCFIPQDVKEEINEHCN